MVKSKKEKIHIIINLGGILLDAHSNVSLALIDHVSVASPTPYIQKVIDDTNPDILFMPDEGAHKRYASAFKTLPSTFGIKHRDWRTGDIKNYEIAEPELIKNANILIIDDICSKGGTFYFAAKVLRDAGATNVNLYITHCEETLKVFYQLYQTRIIIGMSLITSCLHLKIRL